MLGLLVAASLGLSNFAASLGIGVGGVDTRARLRVGTRAGQRGELLGGLVLIGVGVAVASGIR